MLNNRQLALVNLLELLSNSKLSRRDIQNLMLDHYPKTSESNYHDAGLQLITKDINFINNDIESDYLIISNPDGIRLANEQEVEMFLTKEKQSILKRLLLLRNKTFKAKRNNQLAFDIDTLDIFTKVTLQ